MFCLTMAASCIRIKHPLMQNDSSDQETSSNLPKLHNLSKLVTKILQRLRWTYTPIRQCSRRKGECGIKQGFPRGTLQPRENLSQQTLSRLAPPPHLARTGSDAHQTRHWGKPWLAAMVHILGLGTLPRKKNVCLNIYSSRRLWMKRLLQSSRPDNPEETNSGPSQPPPGRLLVAKPHSVCATIKPLKC